MEVTYTFVPARWGYEETTARGIVPPQPDELVDQLDENGEIVTGPDGPVRVPKEGWQPVFSEMELPTVIVVDAQGGNVAKLLFQPFEFGRFLATFVPHLDAEGRQVLYSALRETSDLEVPKVETSGLRLVK